MNKSKNRQFNLLVIIGAMLFCAACGSKTETPSTVTFEASATGPFFSGPNSLIAEYSVDLSALDGLKDVSKDQIDEIKISSVRVILNDENDMDFSSFSSATIQMVSSDVDMQTIAIKNPIETKTQELVFDLSDEVDIADYFKGEKLSLVLDLDFIEDSFIEEIGAQVIMDITVKNN